MSDALCPLCGETSEQDFLPHMLHLPNGDKSFGRRRCNGCRVIYCDPMPDQVEIEYVYKHFYDYAWYLKNRFFKKLQSWHRYHRLKKIFNDKKFGWKPGAILDIGSGHGWFLDAALKDGWSAFGIDRLDDDEVRRMHLRGIEVETRPLEDVRYTAGSFDLITLWHVLEHIVDPRQALQRVERLLKPGGYCVIAVPNRDSVTFSDVGAQWGWLQEPFVHVWTFAAGTLRLVMPAGIEIVEVTSRDTWDQQRFQYSTLFRWYNRYVLYAIRLPRKLAHALKCDQLFILLDALHNFCYWGSLALSYAVYSALRRFFFGRYERDLRANELMVILRKA